MVNRTNNPFANIAVKKIIVPALVNKVQAQSAPQTTKTYTGTAAAQPGTYEQSSPEVGPKGSGTSARRRGKRSVTIRRTNANA